MVTGHGIDVVQASDIARLLLDPGEHFEKRCFTSAEREAAGRSPNRAEFLAGRFAAKEAVLKALGTGFGAGISFADVEIRALPSGAPQAILHGVAQRLAEAAGVTQILVSISHSGGVVVGSALAIDD